MSLPWNPVVNCATWDSRRIKKGLQQNIGDQLPFTGVAEQSVSCAKERDGFSSSQRHLAHQNGWQDDPFHFQFSEPLQTTVHSSCGYPLQLGVLITNLIMVSNFHRTLYGRLVSNVVDYGVRNRDQVHRHSPGLTRGSEGGCKGCGWWASPYLSLPRVVAGSICIDTMKKLHHWLPSSSRTSFPSF